MPTLSTHHQRHATAPTAKIEDTCSGAIACQLIDAHFPGKVPMQKVQWDARNDYEYVNNYKGVPLGSLLPPRLWLPTPPTPHTRLV